MRQTVSSVAQIKKQVRDRDGNQCVKCGMGNNAHIVRFGKQLEVHRIVPGSTYSLEGCETLCKPCHHKKPRRPRGQRHIDEPWLKPVVSVEVDNAFRDEIDRRAKDEGRTRAGVIARAIRFYLIHAPVVRADDVPEPAKAGKK